MGNWEGWSEVEDWSMSGWCNTEEPVLIPPGRRRCHRSTTAKNVHKHHSSFPTRSVFYFILNLSFGKTEVVMGKNEVVM